MLAAATQASVTQHGFLCSPSQWFGVSPSVDTLEQIQKTRGCMESQLCKAAFRLEPLRLQPRTDGAVGEASRNMHRVGESATAVSRERFHPVPWQQGL